MGQVYEGSFQTSPYSLMPPVAYHILPIFQLLHNKVYIMSRYIIKAFGYMCRKSRNTLQIEPEGVLTVKQGSCWQITKSMFVSLKFSLC
jgi:hypothetical protein